jgi:hypothetical protein
VLCGVLRRVEHVDRSTSANSTAAVLTGDSGARE